MRFNENYCFYWDSCKTIGVWAQRSSASVICLLNCMGNGRVCIQRSSASMICVLRCVENDRGLEIFLRHASRYCAQRSPASVRHIVSYMVNDRDSSQHIKTTIYCALEEVPSLRVFIADFSNIIEKYNVSCS